jgi:hypothetical protein
MADKDDDNEREPSLRDVFDRVERMERRQLDAQPTTPAAARASARRRMSAGYATKDPRAIRDARRGRGEEEGDDDDR